LNTAGNYQALFQRKYIVVIRGILELNNLVKYLKSSHFKDTMLSSQDNVATLPKFTIPLENEQSKLQVPISSH
jgi:hypothetical protein